ncbi:MAG: hypothetical protein RLZZ455_1108 [Candidatus Parcubacteria bacterium]
MENPSGSTTHTFHFPKWFVVFCLLFIPPVGWWHMWKNHRYHTWFPYVLWLNSAIMLGFAAYIVIHFYPRIRSLYDATTLIVISHIGLISLALLEIVFGFYLLKKFKNQARLTSRIIGLIILLLFINAIAIPLSQLFIGTQSSAMKTVTNEKNLVKNSPSLATAGYLSILPEQITWMPPMTGTISYTDFAKNLPTRTLSGTLQNGTAILNNLSEASAMNNDFLKNNGWAEDPNQSADGPTGSVWGYKKTTGNKTQILQLRYTNTSITPLPNQPIQVTCPCNLTYTIFLSDPF